MGKADSRAKEFFSDNRRFADICNYVLFDGRTVIRPEQLIEKDTTEVLSVFGANAKQIHIQKWRDILRGTVVRSTHNVCLVLIGMEAQASIHYAMPVKNMIYDALNYGYQVKEAAKNHKDRNDYENSDEFLSGFAAEDKLTPVITITVYLGGDEWNAPRKLSDMYTETDERLLPFLQEFDAHLLVPKEIGDFSRFQTSLKQVFEILAASGDRAAMDAVITSDDGFRALDNETVCAINDFINVNIPVNKKGKVTDMCKAWQDQLELGREKEIFSSVQEGDYDVSRGAEKLGLSEVEFAKRMEKAGYKIPEKI